ncbi:MAG TPA: efflux transporter outer membrane subunit [Opitutaceae bacterium]|nr:efflux transporter outer membrane subunit [Opitutaceae bacterium]
MKPFSGKRAWTGAGLIGAVLGLAGCNLAPKYTRPAADVPAQYREATAPDGVVWSPARPHDQAPRGAWWEAYADPELNELERQVRVSNETIKAAEANFRIARAAALSARSALWPTVSAAPSYTRSHASRTLESASGSRPSASAPGAVDDFSLPFDLSYELDLWGRVRNSAAASGAAAQASAADLATATLSLQAELAQDYFEIRALDAERSIFDDTVRSYRESLQETQALYHSGIDSQEEVARAETQLNTAVAQATDLGVARAAYEHAIAVLVGKAPSQFRLAVAPLTARPPVTPAGLPSDLLLRRPDIAAAERRVAAANAQIGIARTAWFPRLTLGATGGWQSSSAAQWFEWPSRFWSVGPQLAAVLFDVGGRRAASEQARAAFDAATANYRQAVLGAFEGVEDNLAAERILDDEARQQRVAVQSSQQLLDLANTRFRLGIDSYLNVISAQTTLLSNRQTEVQIQLRQMLASIALVKSLGGGWNVSELPRIPLAPAVAAASTGTPLNRQP